MKRYFRAWLLAPLVLGVLGPLLPGAPGWLGGLLIFAGAALMVAGVPYVAFAIGAWVWSGDRSERAYVGAFLLSPVVFALCCFVYWLLMPPVVGAAVDSWSSHALQAVAMSGFCASVSAVYCWPALIVWQMGALLRRR